MEALLVLTTEDSRMFRPELLSTSTHTLILTVFESFLQKIFLCHLPLFILAIFRFNLENDFFSQNARQNIGFTPTNFLLRNKQSSSFHSINSPIGSQ